VAPLGGLAIDVRLKRFAAVGQAPAVVALKDLRFDVALGEFVCVLGPSGCGKTTLLNIVAGLDSAYDGRVVLPPGPGGGRPVIGYVFQQPRLLPWRTVEENLRLVLRRRQADSDIIDELLEATGLSQFRHAYPERLSVGMSRRVALARAFAVEPTLLLMDEPFVSLDEPTADRLRQLLLDIWRRRPTTVLFVTHDTREAVVLADRVVGLSASPGSVESVVSVDVPRNERADPALLEDVRCRVFPAASAARR
jgi:NitT/TauT family transport system ATP-binding protein